MKRHLLVAALAIAAAYVLIQGEDTVTAQAGGTGTIVGHVRLTGPAIANPIIRMGADPLCGKINTGKRLYQEIVLKSTSGGLANAFVSVQGAAARPAPTTPVLLDQKNCTFIPRVIGVQVGQTLQIRNSDPTVHNGHSLSTRGNDFNTSQPKQGMVFTYQLKKEDVMMRLKCDLHSWMTAYLGVMTHPYYSVSDGEGMFTIANVPAGNHTVRAWHERFGQQTKTVAVKAGQTVTVDFAYTGNEKADTANLQEMVLPSGVMAATFLAAH